jgi:hypothetical protein
MDAYALAALVSWIRGLGAVDVTLQTDGEHPIVASRKSVKTRLGDLKVDLRQSPVADPQADGHAEARAVILTMVIVINMNYEGPLGPQHWLSP